MPSPRRPAWAYAAIPVTIVVIVALLVCVGAAAIGIAAALVATIRDLTLTALVGTVVSTALFGISVWLLIASQGVYEKLMDASFWSRYHRRRGECPYCGYPIHGLDSPRCPECGE